MTRKLSRLLHLFIIIFIYQQLYCQELPASSKDSSAVSQIEIFSSGPAILNDSLYGGSLIEIDEKDLSGIAPMDFTAGLEGLVPGLEISSVGGVPGGYVRMNIRGTGTAFAGTEPLILVDGIPFENASYNAAGYRFSGLGELNPNDIESVRVLKDGASRAIYGSRASNGVILIQTKRGTPGKKKVNFSYQYGMTSPSKKIDLLDGEGYMNALNRAWKNSYPDTSINAPIDQDKYDGFYADDYTDTILNESFSSNLSNTDWYSKLMSTGSFHNVNFSLSGGDKNTIYYIGAGYRQEESLIMEGSYKRANARLKIEHQANKRLRLGLNVYLSSVIRDINDKKWFETVHTSALPIYPVISPENPPYYWYSENNPVNIEALNNYSWNRSGGYRTINKAYIQYDILKGLKFRSEWGWDFQHFLHEDYKHPFVAPSVNGLLIINRTNRSNWSNNNYLSYNFSNGIHSVNATAGASFEDYSWGGNMVYNPGMTLAFIHSNGESNQLRTVGVDLANSRWASAYSRIFYSYQGKYSALLTLRGDQSSRYGTENPWFISRAIGVEWDLSKEAFASNIGLLEMAKITASYGIDGNSLIGNFTHMSSLTYGYHDDPNQATNGYYRYGTYPAVIPVNIANTELGPEPNTHMNLGLNMEVLNSRLGILLNYYQNENSGMLNLMPMSVHYGYENTNLWENNGTIVSKGFEVSLNAKILETSSGLNWSVGANISNVSAVLEELPDRVDYIEGYFNRSYEGENFGGYYLAEWVGVDPATGHELILNQETGESVDAEILSDEEFDSFAKFYDNKSPFPKLYGGFFSSLEYKNIDFNILFSFKTGHYILDLGEQSLSYINSGSTGTTDLLNGWTADSPTDIPLLYETSMDTRVTDRFLHDASYVRLQSISLGYTLPESISKKAFLQSTRLYVSGFNLLTFTKFPGYDPNGIHSNYDSSSPLNSGLVMLEPPQPKTMMIGVQFTF